MAEEEQKISMEDKAEGQGEGGGEPEAPASSADNPLGIAEPEKPQRSGDAMLGKYGNNFGDKIQSGLSPVGKPLGKGLETVGKPLGGLIEPLAGGLMKSGGAFGDAAGVGAGNMDHKNAAEEEERKKPIGGQEQTGENPLGL